MATKAPFARTICLLSAGIIALTCFMAFQVHAQVNYVPQPGLTRIQDGVTLTNTMTINSDGSVLVSPIDGKKATYSLGVVQYTPAATATDVAILNGSATKTVRVTRIAVSCLATTAGSLDVSLVKRSTANSGGTSTTPTVVPNDSAVAAVSAVVLQYSANPTAGTAVGTVRNRLVNCGLTGAAGVVAWNFGDVADQAIVLRGVAQGLAINLSGQAIPTGGKVDYEIEWTEE